MIKEEFYIEDDGIKLHAKLDRPEDEKIMPLCILIHGFTGHMEEDHIVAAAKAMNEAGLAVLRVEMYGHGKSGGSFEKHTLYKWVSNALAVVEYAKGLDFVSDLYLCGHSQGGLLTMLVGGMCADDFAGILPMSPAWMIPEYARQGELLGVEFDPEHIPESLASEDWDMVKLRGDYIRVAQTIHVEDEIARYHGPVVIIHGEDDETVPFSYAKKAVELYQNAKLIPIPKADHCFDGCIDELAEAVKDYFA